jgi:predicted ATPase
MAQMKNGGPARIEQLRVENYRALCSIELREITPLTILLGPNGSGKSTVFDVFNFRRNASSSGFATPGTAAAPPGS